jgi:hypothetical protein
MSNASALRTTRLSDKMIDEWIFALGTETQRPVAGRPQDRIGLRVAAGEQSDFVTLTNKLFGENETTLSVPP